LRRGLLWVVLVCCLVQNKGKVGGEWEERKQEDLHTAKSPPPREYFVTRFVVLTFGETKAMAMRFHSTRGGCFVGLGRLENRPARMKTPAQRGGMGRRKIKFIFARLCVCSSRPQNMLSPLILHHFKLHGRTAATMVARLLAGLTMVRFGAIGRCASIACLDSGVALRGA
jgi:hypothetical protein